MELTWTPPSTDVVVDSIATVDADGVETVRPLTAEEIEAGCADVSFPEGGTFYVRLRAVPRGPSDPIDLT